MKSAIRFQSLLLLFVKMLRFNVNRPCYPHKSLLSTSENNPCWAGSIEIIAFLHSVACLPILTFIHMKYKYTYDYIITRICNPQMNKNEEYQTTIWYVL
jgi:hypothetical protein